MKKKKYKSIDELIYYINFFSKVVFEKYEKHKKHEVQISIYRPNDKKLIHMEMIPPDEYYCVPVGISGVFDIDIYENKNLIQALRNISLNENEFGIPTRLNIPMFFKYSLKDEVH